MEATSSGQEMGFVRITECPLDGLVNLAISFE
jgi:hypothetical protein